MTLLYADTSALIRAYFADEADHDILCAQLREGLDPVVTSELARVEFASATYAAARAGRLRKPEKVIARFDEECRPPGPIALLALESSRILPEAQRLVCSHPIRSLDAIHLAVALIDALGLAGGSALAFVSRDDAQRGAAQAEGLELY